DIAGQAQTAAAMTVWAMHDGRVLHPRIGPDGDIYFSTEKLLGRLDPRSATVTTWAPPFPIDNYNGIAVTAAGQVLADAGSFLIRLDPATNRASVWCGGDDFHTEGCRSSGLLSGAGHALTLGAQVIFAAGRNIVIDDTGHGDDFHGWDTGAGEVVDLGSDAQG